LTIFRSRREQPQAQPQPQPQQQNLVERNTAKQSKASPALSWGFFPAARNCSRQFTRTKGQYYQASAAEQNRTKVN